MATGGSSHSGPGGTCPVCMDEFARLKSLPCHHAFCQRCIWKWAERHTTGSFLCPLCRRLTAVPYGGVAAFPDNTHISSDPARARNHRPCSTRPEERVEDYLVDLHNQMRAKDVTIKHKLQDTEGLGEADNETRHQLEADQGLPREAGSHLTEPTSAQSRGRQPAQKAAVEAAIRRKHAWLVSRADACRDEVLASLNRLNDEDYQVVASQVESPRRSFINRPVLRCRVMEELIGTLVRDFFGVVKNVAEVEVVEQFRCGEENNTEVFSVCPLDDGSELWLSFARRANNEDAPLEKFDEKGKLIAKDKTNTSKVSLKSRGNGKTAVAINTTRRFCIYDKSQKDTIFLLSYDTANHEGCVVIFKVTSETPFRTQQTTLFSVSTGPQRAFAVDSSEQFFVVVEEGVAPNVQRKVRLYRRDQRDAVATYRPSSAACRPSDVCFWQRPDGREILVVADEGTDSLHVLDVRDGTLRFEGYVTTGSPIIVQPTALNTDTRGRLWVALRGGRIFTLSYVTR